MRSFVVTCSGKRVSEDDINRIISASNTELITFCSAWNLSVPSLRYCPDGLSVEAGEDVIDLADQPPLGESGVLGSHTEIHDQRRGVVYAGYELDHGGRVLALDEGEPSDAVTIASIFFHELVEQLVNGFTNQWWDGPITAGGQVWASVAAEVADPVEDGFVKQNGVWLSNYILPAWADSQAITGPFDALGSPLAPFTYSGYVVVRNGPGTETPIFPAGYPAHRRVLKEAAWKARLAR